MTTEEGNKIIAVFDGWEETKHIDEEFGNLFIKYGESKYADGFKYELSWDWLMPVVEKIEELEFSFTIVNNQAYIMKDEDYPNGKGVVLKEDRTKTICLASRGFLPRMVQ